MSRQAVYQAGQIKRTRRSKAQLLQLNEQIMEVLIEDHPQSIRHVFYMMTNPRLPEPVEKSDSGYNLVQRQVSKLRRAGILPYGWITDATRRGYHVNTFDGSEDFVKRMAGLYRADLWDCADVYVEVWAESRSIAGVIEGDCSDLAVSLYPSGGFTSHTLAYQAAEHIIEATNHGQKPAIILYIGDYDKAGVLIDVSIEQELRRHLPPEVRLDFRRIAVTEEQIAEFDLPTKPAKTSDRRSGHINIAVEAEALPAYELRSLLRREIEAYVPEGALEAIKVAEASERDHLRKWASIMGGARQ